MRRPLRALGASAAGAVTLMHVSIVVPAINHWDVTNDCIERLLATTARELLADLIVVDDGSNDGESAAWTAAQRTFTPSASIVEVSPLVAARFRRIAIGAYA